MDSTLWNQQAPSHIFEPAEGTSLKLLLARKGVPVEERRFSRDYLYCADEAFMCGTAAEITPVREVDDRRIGAGGMGPITAEIQGTFFRAVRGQEARYAEWLYAV